jgi:hypothetical protein
MWRQEMLPSIVHGCHFDTISSFSLKNFVPDIFDQTSYNKILSGYQSYQEVKRRKKPTFPEPSPSSSSGYWCDWSSNPCHIYTCPSPGARSQEQKPHHAYLGHVWKWEENIPEMCVLYINEYEYQSALIFWNIHSVTRAIWDAFSRPSASMITLILTFDNSFRRSRTRQKWRGHFIFLYTGQSDYNKTYTTEGNLNAEFL